MHADPTATSSSPDLSRRECYALYRRLLAFAKPYRLRLGLGILAGILSAGTLFVIFDNANDAVASFRSGEKKTVEVADQEAQDPVQPPKPEGADQKIQAKLDRIEQRLARNGVHVKLRNEDNSITWQGLAFVLLAIPLLIVFRIVTSVLNHYYMRWVGAAVVRDVRNAIFSTLQKQSLKFYGNIDIGELIS
ncbi:MAG: hypothetical protein IJK04_07200, partial [Kiritimatiellae bacterium]|nr:hypothetical protein [Kiritimatiellia bacterium]